MSYILDYYTIRSIDIDFISYVRYINSAYAYSMRKQVQRRARDGQLWVGRGVGRSGSVACPLRCRLNQVGLQRWKTRASSGSDELRGTYRVYGYRCPARVDTHYRHLQQRALAAPVANCRGNFRPQKGFRHWRSPSQGHRCEAKTSPIIRDRVLVSA